MMKEMYSVKCPEHIVFGDPWYFKTEPKDRLKGLVVDCTVPKEFEAIVALESENRDGYDCRTMYIYLAPKGEAELYTVLYDAIEIGSFRNFPLLLKKHSMGADIMIAGKNTYKVEVSTSDVGNMVRLENVLNGLDKDAELLGQKIHNYEVDLENAKMEYAKEFQYEGLLKEKLRRQTEINSQLEIKEEEEVVMAEEMEETIAPPQAATIAR